MREFLIRTTINRGWPAVPSDRIAEVLQPEGWVCKPISGSGDFRVRTNGAEVSYISEKAGWRIVIDGKLPNTEDWIEQVAQQVSEATGELCEWLEL